MQRVAPSVTARQQPHVIDDYGKDPAPPHPRTPRRRPPCAWGTSGG